MERGLFVVTGIMASGKTTVGQLLAERFARGVHVHGDIFRRMIVTGREEMRPDASDEAMAQLRLRYRLAAAATDGYVEAGFSVVLQDVVIGPMLTELVEMIRSRPLHLVVLCPRPEVVAAREAARNKRGYVTWDVAGLDRILREETPRIGMWLDSSEQTPEETVEAIWQRAWTEAVIG